MDIISRNEAITLNQKWFFTGKPCKYGHVAKRLVKNYLCYQCSSEKGVKFRERNPNYHHEYNKEWYQDNKEITQKHSEAYYERMRENDPEELKRRYSKNSNEYRKRHHDKIRERDQNWRQNNKGYCNTQTAKRRATKVNATPEWVDEEEIRAIYEECRRINKRSRENYVVDHIIPLNNKRVCGLHVPWNLQIITLQENAAKSNKLLENI